MLKWLMNLFHKKQNPLENIKSGDAIVINWKLITGGIGAVLVVNNDLKTGKLLIEANWTGIGKQRYIMEYSDPALSDFNLLNPPKIDQVKEEEVFDIATLQKKINEALEQEKYEDVDKWQKQINKLLKK